MKARIIFFIVSLLILNYLAFDKSLQTLAIAILMFSLWVSELIPISATAALPIILFPIFGIMDLDMVLKNYVSDIVLLFLGGFLLARAMHKWQLSRRIALNIIKYNSSTNTRLILGFMGASAFLSMWTSNTATTIMMLPIALAVIETIKSEDHEYNKKIMLAIAYAASVGGMATIIGTPTNAVLVSYLKNTYGFNYDFDLWLIRHLPLVIILIMTFWLILIRKITKIDISHNKNLILSEIKAIGRISFEEKIILITFSIVILFWVFKSILPYQPSHYIVGLTGALILFLFPNKKFNKTILSYKDIKYISWSTLVLFGGGLSLAKAMELSGLVDIIAGHLEVVTKEQLLLGILLSIILATFLTEFMSNVALIAILIPVLATLSLAITGDVLTLTVPATLAASCAFMMPISTPPNAIVFASGHVSIKEMLRAGFIFNLVAIAIIYIYSILLLEY